MNDEGRAFAETAASLYGCVFLPVNIENYSHVTPREGRFGCLCTAGRAVRFFMRAVTGDAS
jgi:hypothetical protein